MSGRDLIMGLSHVDEKYVNEAENEAMKGSAKKPWIKWISAAACLCAALWGLLSLEPIQTANDAEQMQENAAGNNGASIELEPESSQTAEGNQTIGVPEFYEFTARCIPADGSLESVDYPLVTVINSRELLGAYCDTNKERLALSAEFLDACERYDDHYFASQSLILILLEGSGGTVCPAVENVQRNADGEWVITIQRQMDEDGTGDMARRYILLEVQRKIETDAAITIQFAN